MIQEISYKSANEMFIFHFYPVDDGAHVAFSVEPNFNVTKDDMQVTFDSIEEVSDFLSDCAEAFLSLDMTRAIKPLFEEHIEEARHTVNQVDA